MDNTVIFGDDWLQEVESVNLSIDLVELLSAVHVDNESPVLESVLTEGDSVLILEVPLDISREVNSVFQQFDLVHLLDEDRKVDVIVWVSVAADSWIQPAERCHLELVVESAVEHEASHVQALVRNGGIDQGSQKLFRSMDHEVIVAIASNLHLSVLDSLLWDS